MRLDLKMIDTTVLTVKEPKTFSKKGYMLWQQTGKEQQLWLWYYGSVQIYVNHLKLN